MNILMASAEMVPLAKTGGLGDVLGALPKALGALGHTVTIVLPFYRQIGADKYGISKTGDWFEAALGGQRVFGGLHYWQAAPGVGVWLVAQDELYGRDGIYGDRNGTFGDNHRRYIFLSLATLEVARRMAQAGNPPDVFHGHDWHVGLVPLYLREGRAGFRIPSVFSIHNLQYQGRFGRDVLHQAGLSGAYDHSDRLELFGSISFMKAGLQYADVLSTVSRAYAREVQTAEFGEGLQGLLIARRDRFFGIVNGVDTATWSPAADPYLPARYSPGDMQGKDVCKLSLQKEMGLDVSLERPLVAVVSRLVDQKGISLMAEVLPRLLQRGGQFVLVGSGDRYLEQLFTRYSRQLPGRVAAHIGFDEELAHRVEAGADIFVMPSKFEPCGLNQMYSLTYGTVPVVRAVGGLDDTVRDVAFSQGKGNGYKFESFNADGLWWALERALRAFEEGPRWRQFRESIMGEDFSWETAAGDYLTLYTLARRWGL